MKNRRGFLTLLGLAPAAAVLAPKIVETALRKDMVVNPEVVAVDEQLLAQNAMVPAKIRYLGLAQLKNEGDPVIFDNEISQFAKEAFGRKELYQWPDNDWEDEA